MPRAAVVAEMRVVMAPAAMVVAAVAMVPAANSRPPRFPEPVVPVAAVMRQLQHWGLFGHPAAPPSIAPVAGVAAKADGDASSATTVMIFRVFQCMGHCR